MKKISNMILGEGALVDTRSICRDPNWQIRVSTLYDAMPLMPIPTGIQIAYIEKIRRQDKNIFKIFYPERDMKKIPLMEWPSIYEINAVPIAIVNWLDPTPERKLCECLPEFPCRICKLREQEKHDVCIFCNRILCHFMGKSLEKIPNCHKMIVREHLIKKLAKVKINAYYKNK